MEISKKKLVTKIRGRVYPKTATNHLILLLLSSLSLLLLLSSHEIRNVNNRNGRPYPILFYSLQGRGHDFRYQNKVHERLIQVVYVSLSTPAVCVRMFLIKLSSKTQGLFFGYTNNRRVFQFAYTVWRAR